MKCNNFFIKSRKKITKQNFKEFVDYSSLYVEIKLLWLQSNIAAFCLICAHP